jgi:opacity protein-like surface antigen
MKLIKQLRLAPTKNNLLNALIVTTALVGIQTHSQAQTSKFEGTRLYLGNSFLSSNTKAKRIDDNNGLSETEESKQSSDIPVISLSHTIKFDSKYLVTFGAAYSDKGKTDYVIPLRCTEDIDFGGHPSCYTGGISDTALPRGAKIDFGSDKSIFLQPSYIINENTLGFLKLGYHNMPMRYSDGYSLGMFPNGPPVSKSQNLDGIGIGAGVEFFFNKNVLFKVEAEHIQYEKMNIPSGNTVTSSGGGNLKPSSNNLTISVGYQF